jgi:integrase/recombinase XerD
MYGGSLTMAMAERRLAKATPPSARRLAVELRREAPQDLTWEAAVDLFLEGWAADHPGIRPRTLGHYRDQLITRIAAFARDRGIASVGDFSRYDLRAFVAWLDRVVTYAGRPLTPRGKQMALDTARRFLLWLYQERLLPEDIGAQVATYRLDTDPEPRSTPGADLEKILSSLDLGRPTGVRNMAMIHLMAFCGLRVAELVGLNASDLDLEEGRVRVKAETSKVRRARFVDLPLTVSDGREVVKPEVADLMASWLTLRSRACPHLRDEDALFVTLGPNQFAFRTRETEHTSPEVRSPGERLTTDAVRTILRRLAARAGVDPALLTPHRLRHYFGLTSAKAGVPTTALMRAMGHRSPIMTARYSEFADSERRWAFARADITKGLALPSTR